MIKKLVSILLLFGSLTFLVFAENILPPELNRALFFGIKGEDASSLQAYLAQDKTIYPEGLVTGFFGRLTEAAVKRFQTKYGIESVGIVGPITRAKLKELRQQVQAPSPAPAPEPISSEPTPSPTPVPATPPANPADLIKTGTGIVDNNQFLKIGPLDFYYTGSYGYAGRGYLMPGAIAGAIANITKADNSPCEDIPIRNYLGISNICQFTNPANYTFSEHKDAVRVYDKGTYYTVGKTCYQGLLLFKQNNIYGAIDPEDVDIEGKLHYKYWYDESGGANFGSLCPSAGNGGNNLASTLDSLTEALQKLKSLLK